MTETAQRAGHIPGAASIPWAQTVREDGTFKGREELENLYEAKGVTPDKDVIAYCRIGERSSHSWFVLHELLGYQRVRNYDGRWTEWGSMVGDADREAGSRSPSKARTSASRVGDQAGRVDEIRLAAHELVAVGDPEAEIEQRPQDRAGALDAGEDDAAAGGSRQRGHRDRHGVDGCIGMDDEPVQDADRAGLPGTAAADRDDLVAVDDTTKPSASACAAQNRWSTRPVVAGPVALGRRPARRLRRVSRPERRRRRG